VQAQPPSQRGSGAHPAASKLARACSHSGSAQSYRNICNWPSARRILSRPRRWESWGLVACPALPSTRHTPSSGAAGTGLACLVLHLKLPLEAPCELLVRTLLLLQCHRLVRGAADDAVNLSPSRARGEGLSYLRTRYKLSWKMAVYLHGRATQAPSQRSHSRNDCTERHLNHLVVRLPRRAKSDCPTTGDRGAALTLVRLE
jgi:hypothetical protein